LWVAGVCTATSEGWECRGTNPHDPQLTVELMGAPEGAGCVVPASPAASARYKECRQGLDEPKGSDEMEFSATRRYHAPSLGVDGFIEISVKGITTLDTGESRCDVEVCDSTGKRRSKSIDGIDSLQAIARAIFIAHTEVGRIHAMDDLTFERDPIKSFDLQLLKLLPDSS